MPAKRKVKVSAKVTITDRLGKPVDKAKVEGRLSSAGRKPVPVVLTPTRRRGVYGLLDHEFEVAASADRFMLEITRVGELGDGLEGELQAIGMIQTAAFRATTRDIFGKSKKRQLADLIRAATAKLQIVDGKEDPCSFEQILAEMRTVKGTVEPHCKRAWKWVSRGPAAKTKRLEDVVKRTLKESRKSPGKYTLHPKDGKRLAKAVTELRNALP